MSRIGFIVKVFMLVACIVPFTSTRQAGALLALDPTVPVQNVPAPQEDDSERSEQVGKVRIIAAATGSPVGRARIGSSTPSGPSSPVSY